LIKDAELKKLDRDEEGTEVGLL